MGVPTKGRYSMQVTIMKNIILLLTILTLQMTLCRAYHVNIQLTLNDNQQEKALMEQQNLVTSLAEDLDTSLQDLSHCGFSKILKCTGKVTEAISQCSNHPDITKCIEQSEILGANSECKECIHSI